MMPEPPPSLQPSRLKATSHLHTRSHTWSNPAEHSPSPPRDPFQGHRTRRLPRTTLRLTTDTARSRNTLVSTRASHPRPQDHEHLLGLAGKASHPEPRVHADR